MAQFGGDRLESRLQTVGLEFRLQPMLGQIHQFVKYNPGKSPFAEERYLKEGLRLYAVLDRQLQDRQFIVDEYSIVDIAVWPWVSRFEWQTIDLRKFPNVCRWYLEVAARPAVTDDRHVCKNKQYNH